MTNPYLFRLLNLVQKSDLLPIALRRALLRAMGAQVDAACNVLSGCHFVQGSLRIGAGAFLNHGCYVEASGGVTIGAGAHLAQRVAVITQSHRTGPSRQRAGELVKAPVAIGDGAWIGADCTILPGAEIGRGAIVGARSLVRGHLQGDHLHAGTPASSIRPVDAADAASPTDHQPPPLVGAAE